MEEKGTFATKEVETEYREPSQKQGRTVPPIPIQFVMNQESSSNIENENFDDDEDPYFELKVKAINDEPLGDLDEDTYEGLLFSLKEERNQLTENNYFEESKLINEAYQRVLKAYEEQKKKAAQKEAYKENRKRLKAAKKEYKETEEGFKRQEELLKQRLKEKMKRIEEKHQHQIDSYQAEWSSPSKMRKYSKSSSQLNALRIQARKLMNASRYDEAKAVTAEAEALQEQETLKQQRAMQNDYMVGLDTILANQKVELDTVKKSNDLEIGKLQNDKKIALEVCKKRISNIEAFTESTKDEEKVWSRKKMSFQRPTVLLSSTRSLSAVEKTSRAASSFNRLNIQPIIPAKIELSNENYSSLV